jgi:hypothetical protein
VDAKGKGQYTLTTPIHDAFAAWVNELDQAESRSAWAQYVSPEMTGAEELDRHGRWERGPEAGMVWVPHAVPAGWAPFSHGHWTWVHPWGWTWVDDAPWGFAPFHYGRWVWHRSRWCWSPGRYVARPVYAPALVVWAGSGSGIGISIHLGGGRHRHPVAWYPLGYADVYVPSYSSSVTYVQNINVTHVTHITHVSQIIQNPAQAVQQGQYTYRNSPHAWTVAGEGVLRRRESVQAAVQRLRESGQAQSWRAGQSEAWSTLVRPPTQPERPSGHDRASPSSRLTSWATRRGDPGPGSAGLEGADSSMAQTLTATSAQTGSLRSPDRPIPFPPMASEERSTRALSWRDRGPQAQPGRETSVIGLRPSEAELPVPRVQAQPEPPVINSPWQLLRERLGHGRRAEGASDMPRMPQTHAQPGDWQPHRSPSRRNEVPIAQPEVRSNPSPAPRPSASPTPGQSGGTRSWRGLEMLR